MEENKILQKERRGLEEQIMALKQDLQALQSGGMASPLTSGINANCFDLEPTPLPMPNLTRQVSQGLDEDKLANSNLFPF